MGSTMPTVACKVVSLQGRFFEEVSVAQRRFFSCDVEKKLQVSLFCIVRRARYRCPSCLCYRPLCAVARLHYHRPSYRRLPSSLLLSDLRLLLPSEHCCLPSLLPPELLSLAFAIAARVTVTAHKADVRGARVYRLQSLQACYAGLGFGGRTYRYKKSDAARNIVVCVLYMTTAPSVSVLYTLLQKSVL